MCSYFSWHIKTSESSWFLPSILLFFTYYLFNLLKPFDSLGSQLGEPWWLFQRKLFGEMYICYTHTYDYYTWDVTYAGHDWAFSVKLRHNVKVSERSELHWGLKLKVNVKPRTKAAWARCPKRVSSTPEHLMLILSMYQSIVNNSLLNVTLYVSTSHSNFQMKAFLKKTVNFISSLSEWCPASEEVSFEGCEKEKMDLWWTKELFWSRNATR